MDEIQRKMKDAVDNLINDLDKNYLRDIQQRMFHCSGKCCDDKRSSRQSIEECVDRCSIPLKKAQTSLETELGALQVIIYLEIYSKSILGSVISMYNDVL
jgi:hypothetical protein